MLKVSVYGVARMDIYNIEYSYKALSIESRKVLYNNNSY